MVAITVAIAATVYVYVSGMLGERTSKAPSMAFNRVTTGTKGLTLVSADAGLLWSDFQILKNSTITLITTPVANSVLAGHIIALQGNVVGITTIRHTLTNTLMSTWTWA